MSQPQPVIVLFGGQSAEHDVSCVSAAHVLNAIDRDGFAVRAVGISRTGEWREIAPPDQAVGAGADLAPLALGEASADEPAALAETAERTGALLRGDAADMTPVVIPVLHGPMGEDGTVQGMLELAGLPYVGTGVLGSALCMDKSAAKEMAASRGIPQCRWETLLLDHAAQPDPLRLDQIVAHLGLPLFVKPANMGSSVGVSRADGRADLLAAATAAGVFDECVIVEEAVEGREIEVAVLGNRGGLRASVPGEIEPGDDFYSYDDKYHDGVARTVVPAALSPQESDEVRALAVNAAEALRVEGLARVDFFYEEGGRGFLLNEVNTMPGFTPISMYPKLWAASGLSYGGLISELVALAVQRHERRSRHRSSTR